MTLDLPEEASSWDYVGEGNQNLVVKYIGEDTVFVSKKKFNQQIFNSMQRKEKCFVF